MQLDRKIVVVTGASQGIGAGIVKEFVERGFNVVANDRMLPPEQVLNSYFRPTSILRSFRPTARQFMSVSADKARRSCCFTDSETQATCGHLWLPSLHATTESSFQTCAAWGSPHIPPMAMIRRHKQLISVPFLFNSVSIMPRSLGMTSAQRLPMPMPPVTPIKPTGWW